jgi:hypothetical protein
MIHLSTVGIIEQPQPTELWLPSSQARLVAWIDAADKTSYTLSGTTITGVTDKASVYNINVNGTPTASVGLNSLNIFDFDGNEYLQSTSYESQTTSGNHWAIGVFRFNSVNNTKDSFWSYETNASPKRDYAVSSSANNNTWPGELDLDGLSSNRISNTIGNSEEWNLKSIQQNTYAITAVYFNKTGNQIGTRVDGQAAFKVVNDYSNPIQPNQELRLMRNRSSVELDGQLAEYFAVADIPGSGSTDISTLEKGEGYLAWKWGLVALLPNNHPYKNSAPVV